MGSGHIRELGQFTTDLSPASSDNLVSAALPGPDDCGLENTVFLDAVYSLLEAGILALLDRVTGHQMKLVKWNADNFFSGSSCLCRCHLMYLHIQKRRPA